MDETTLSTESIYEGRVIRVERLEVELEDGTQTTREVVRHGGAVAVIARREDGRFVFVRQFRKALERDLFEVVAGGIDPGEEPEVAARRELLEESGYAAGALTFLGSLFPAPGYTDERIDVFFTEVANEAGALDPDDDERVEVLALSRAEVESMFSDGECVDGKTLGAWLMFEKRVESDV